MEYPIFDVPLLGGSLLIAGVAIFHAFIAHFSVGSGFFVALAERRAIRANDSETMAFLKRYALLILLVPYVVGTVTGAGIWFTIALVSPRAVSVLIHQFVWDWATEWVLFLIEIVSIYLYVFTWDRVSPRPHNTIGWVFAVASLLTLLVINAILSFMLTPGGWVPHAPGAVWKALFNPSYFPTTLVRILAAFALAGTGAIVLATLLPGLACFVGLLSLAAARDAVRRAALAPHFRLTETPVHAEWSSFLLFLVTFVVGLGVIAWLIRLGRPVREQPPAPAAT